jgi:hypothetical protein
MGHEWAVPGTRYYATENGVSKFRDDVSPAPHVDADSGPGVSLEILRLAKENERLKQHAELVEARNESLERVLHSVTEAQEILREHLRMSRHPTPPAQEGEEPPDTSPPASRD